MNRLLAQITVLVVSLHCSSVLRCDLPRISALATGVGRGAGNRRAAVAVDFEGGGDDAAGR